MAAYSRTSPMPNSGEVPRITGLNSFGEPFRGNKIRGVQAKRYMGGGNQGPLSARPVYNAKVEAEKAVVEGERKEREAAAQRGRQASIQANAPSAAASPPKPKPTGRLAARKARQQMNYGQPPKVRLIDGRPAQEFDPALKYQNGRVVRPQTYAPLERMA